MRFSGAISYRRDCQRNSFHLSELCSPTPVAKFLLGTFIRAKHATESFLGIALDQRFTCEPISFTDIEKQCVAWKISKSSTFEGQTLSADSVNYVTNQVNQGSAIFFSSQHRVCEYNACSTISWRSWGSLEFRLEGEAMWAWQQCRDTLLRSDESHNCEARLWPNDPNWWPNTSGFSWTTHGPGNWVTAIRGWAWIQPGPLVRGLIKDGLILWPDKSPSVNQGSLSCMNLM